MTVPHLSGRQCELNEKLQELVIRHDTAFRLQLARLKLMVKPSHKAVEHSVLISFPHLGLELYCVI